VYDRRRVGCCAAGAIRARRPLTHHTSVTIPLPPDAPAGEEVTVATASQPSDAEVLVDLESRSWWVYLVTGALWLIFAFVVLSARSEITTVWAVVVYAGILFFLVGVGEAVTAMVVDSWKWLHWLFAIAAFVAGIVAFAWPDQTFITLAAILAWYLLFDGVFNIVGSLMGRHVVEFWWMFLVMGIVEVLIAFWAIGYPGRSIILLIIWVGATALAKGLAQIVKGFALHSVRRELTAA
jgi:uncharacterized membrane protein HdeD (DUF308 family)